MATAAQDPSHLPPELIVVAHPHAELRIHGSQVRSAAGDAAPLEQALTETGARARPLFGPSEERIQARRQESPWDLPDLSDDNCATDRIPKADRQAEYGGDA